jgi:hypothetical protein
LVFTLELAVEDHAIDSCPSLAEALGLTKVRPKHLGVVFHFARLLEVRVEGLIRSCRWS